MLECEFLALIFIVVYVGAIAVLFLFAVMMLDAKLQNLSRNVFRIYQLGFFCFRFFIPVLYQIFQIHKEKKFFQQIFIKLV
jgi:NADH-quinone oxidoreductase subunit J